MFKAQTIKIFVGALLVLMSGIKIVWSEESQASNLSVPTAQNSEETASQSEKLAEFQNWLKNNGHDATTKESTSPIMLAQNNENSAQRAAIPNSANVPPQNIEAQSAASASNESQAPAMMSEQSHASRIQELSDRFAQLRDNQPPSYNADAQEIDESASSTQMMLAQNNESSTLPESIMLAQNNNASIPPPPLASPEVMRKKLVHHKKFRVSNRPLTFRQEQELMVKSAPPASPPSEESNIAFHSMMQKNMPLSPQQVVRLRQLIDVSQRAAAVPANIPPKPVSTTLMINLAPGTTPPAIRLAQGYVSTLLFVDSTGAPWPIASYDMGDPKSQTVQWDQKSNVLLIQAVSPYSDSNLVIRLVGLPTPITLELVSGQRVVDYRADIHVAGLGPDTKELPTGLNLPASASQVLLSVLDGVAPGGSKLLTVTGGDCQAWLLGDLMYLRTRLTVLSPGWVGKMVSSDGMNAYELQRTSTVLVSQYGNPIELKIEGF